jgi:hypothetical protein
MWRKGLVALVALGLFFSLAAQREKSYSADRFDVSVTVQEDGALLVQESVTFRFVGGPFTFVFRELPLDHTDGITDITAAVDGRALLTGPNPGQVEITGRDPIRITWHLEPTTDATHTFDLTYRVLGVARQASDADVLEWQALPDDYEYAIGRSQVTLTYPPTAVLLAPPTILAGDATVAAEASQVSFTARDLAPGDPLVVGLRFQPGSLISAPPAWQARQAEQNRFGWLWLLGAGLALAGGMGGLLVALAPYQRSKAKPAGVTYHPPADLPPALAGALYSGGGQPGWQHALGTLFDLAERGLLVIEERPQEKWYSRRDYTVRQVAEATDLAPHEQSLLDLLFTTKSGERTAEVDLSQLNHLVTSSRWKQYSERVKAEVKAAGWLSAVRQQKRRRLMAWGVVLLLLSFVSLLLALLFNALFGLWPLAVTAALFLLALLWLIVATSLSILSDEGAEAVARWASFYSYLRDVTRGRASVTQPDMFEQYLPYAAAFGLLPAWARYFAKSGWTQVPAYFHALSAADHHNMAAFVAMTAASSSSGGAGAGAGAAGAGAAGGGASGAG